MQRVKIIPRVNWKEKLEEIGMKYHHTREGLYWDESAHYIFSNLEQEKLRKVSEELHQMCLQAVNYIIEKDYFSKFGINENYKKLIIHSWVKNDFHLYGRFDLSYSGGDSEPKMLEYNADTPTSLFESAYVTREWLLDIKEQEYSSFHNKIVKRWKLFSEKYKNKIHFFSVRTLEDIMNTRYLELCAKEAGFETVYNDIKSMVFDDEKKYWRDRNHQKIEALFKLYPWETISEEDINGEVSNNYDTIIYIEPVWKMLLSNKAILPVLWEMFPGHANLLESYFDSPQDMTDYVVKPILSRKGANIKIYKGGDLRVQTAGAYEKYNVIYQKLHELPNFDGNYTVVGSWVIGDDFAGVGIRESKNLVTDNYSRFVPTIFE